MIRLLIRNNINIRNVIVNLKVEFSDDEGADTLEISSAASALSHLH